MNGSLGKGTHIGLGFFPENNNKERIREKILYKYCIKYCIKISNLETPLFFFRPLNYINFVNRTCGPTLCTYYSPETVLV